MWRSRSRNSSALAPDVAAELPAATLALRIRPRHLVRRTELARKISRKSFSVSESSQSSAGTKKLGRGANAATGVAGALRFQAQELIPIPLVESVFDFAILGSVEVEEHDAVDSGA